MSKPHYNWCKANWPLEVVMDPPLEVPTHGYGQIYDNF